MLHRTGLLLTAVLGISLFASSAGNAAIFKCVGADGEVSYNQTPCEPTAQTAKVLRSASTNKQAIDCRIANNFARKTAIGMHAGQSSGDVFASYGGIDAIPRTAIGVINYVYTHKENVNTNAQRIAALSAARCSGGSYGAVACEDFPYGFISELGGCEAAKGSTMGNTLPAAATNKPKETETNGATQALGVRTAAETSSTSASCQNSVQDKLNQLFVQMGAGQSANSQDALEEQKKALKKQLIDC